MSTVARLYAEIKALCGYIVGERAICALRSAKRAARAEDAGLDVIWTYDDDMADPGDFISARAWREGLQSGRYEVLCARVESEDGEILAALGGIIVDNSSADRQAYIRGFELELLAEAGAQLDDGSVS